MVHPDPQRHGEASNAERRIDQAGFLEGAKDDVVVGERHSAFVLGGRARF